MYDTATKWTKWRKSLHESITPDTCMGINGVELDPVQPLPTHAGMIHADARRNARTSPSQISSATNMIDSGRRHIHKEKSYRTSASSQLS
jgi:hypothetical protein